MKMRHPNRRAQSGLGKKMLGNGAMSGRREKTPPRLREISGGSTPVPDSRPEEIKPTEPLIVEPPRPKIPSVVSRPSKIAMAPLASRPYVPRLVSTGVVTYSEGGRGL